MTSDDSPVSAFRFAAVAMVASAALTASTSVGAQDWAIYEFGEIIVTGDRPRVVDQVTTVDVVTAEEISRAGARTVDEAIALLPGLYVRRGAQGVSLIDVRGLRTRNVLLLLDGVPLNSSFDGFFDPATLSVENVAKIKLTRGASSVLYGPGGNAGVLNIMTRAAGDRTDASLHLERGSTGSSNLRGQASFRRGPLGIVFSGSLYNQDYFELSGDFEPTTLEDGGRRRNSDREDGSAFASLTFDVSEATSLGVNFNYRMGERGKPPITEDFRLSDFAPRPRFERVDYEAMSVHAALSHEVGGSLDFRAVLFLNQADELTDGFDDNSFSTQNAAGGFREDATAKTFGASLQLALRQGSRGLATLALDLREEQWDTNGFTVVSAGGGAGGGGGGGNRFLSVPFDDDRSVRISSLAAEYELTPGGPFTAVLGAGYAAQNRPGVETDEGFNLLVGATYAWTPENTLRGSVARQIRFPTLRDLYRTDRGNPELKAERTFNYEVAIEREAGSGTSNLKLALFRIDADDFIQGTPGDILRNIQRTRRQGVELQGRHRFDKDLRLTWSYTYLDATNRSPEADITTIQSQPEHKVSLTAEGATSIGLRLRGELLFVANSFALSRTRPTRAMELGDYTVLGLSLSQSLRTDRIRVIGRLSNALDEDYADSIGFPSPGRTLFAGLELRSGS